MKSYRLVVRQNGRMVGHFDTCGTAALEDICVARAMFGIAGGYDCELLVADSERRMLESGPEGMKILMREACYRPVTAHIELRMALRLSGLRYEILCRPDKRSAIRLANGSITENSRCDRWSYRTDQTYAQAADRHHVLTASSQSPHGCGSDQTRTDPAARKRTPL